MYLWLIYLFDIFEILIMKIKYFSKVYKLYTPFFYNVLWLRTEREGWNRSLNKNAKNGTEREGRSSTQNGTERDGTERERNDKKKRNENGTIKLKPLVLERNGTISKKSERAQPYLDM